LIDKIKFSRSEAFERNIGLITIDEQRKLESSLVVIAGCGGVGGLHAHTLSRLGIGRFRIIDADTFSLANINRQIGATSQSIGRSKVEVTAEMIRSINPEAIVDVSNDFITAENAAAFVRGANLVVDGVDFFALPGRRQLFAAAWDAQIPALTAAPLGFSATLHVFARGGMSFDEYFDLRDGQDPFEQLMKFIVGLAPSALHLPYMDLSTVKIETGRGPSSIIGCQMAATIAGGEALAILLGKRKAMLAPMYLQYDAFRQIQRRRRLNGGNKNWIQRLKRHILTKKFRELGLESALLKNKVAPVKFSGL
jgi:molybdopterin/thiamine biosynthesis adenylyltransferase